MRRRRSFLRPRIGRPIARNMLANDTQIALQEAHDLMGQGEFQKAATIFDRLAEGVLRRGFVGRAPFLFVQAGRAYYLGGNSRPHLTGTAIALASVKKCLATYYPRIQPIRKT
jgi:hypothetical protein